MRYAKENEDGSWTVRFDPPITVGRLRWWQRLWRWWRML